MRALFRIGGYITGVSVDPEPDPYTNTRAARVSYDQVRNATVAVERMHNFRLTDGVHVLRVSKDGEQPLPHAAAAAAHLAGHRYRPY